MQSTPRPADTYNPLYFLASVSSGGLTVTFFMYLMFWVPHPGRPVPVFDDIMTAVTTGSIAIQTGILAALIGIAFFTVLGILFMWQDQRLHTTFDGQASDADKLIFLTKAIAIQLTFLGLGLVVLLRQGYFRDFVFGFKSSPGSYALVSPSVALSVIPAE